MTNEGGSVILSQATIRVYKQTKIGDDICYRVNGGDLQRGIINEINDEDMLDQTPLPDPLDWRWTIGGTPVGTSRSINDIYPANQIYTDPQN